MLRNHKCKPVISCCISSVYATSCITLPIFLMIPSASPIFKGICTTVMGVSLSTLINQLVDLLYKSYCDYDEPNQDVITEQPAIRDLIPAYQEISNLPYVITEQPAIRDLIPAYQEISDLPSYEEATAESQGNPSDNLIAQNTSSIAPVHTVGRGN